METDIEFIPDFAMDDEVTQSIEELVSKAMRTREDDEWEKNKKAQRCIIIDIDGTLADVRGGLRKTKKGEFDWKEFFRNIPFYPPNEWCVRLAQIYYQMGFVVNIVSARPASHRERTEDWLAKYGVPYDFFYMREEGDLRPDVVIKKEILDREFKDKSLIEFCVDDRPEVCELWRENGLTCLQCNSHEFI